MGSQRLSVLHSPAAGKQERALSKLNPKLHHQHPSTGLLMGALDPQIAPSWLVLHHLCYRPSLQASTREI